MKATVPTTAELVQKIDKQLQAILLKDIPKIGSTQLRNAAFLQLIAAKWTTSQHIYIYAMAHGLYRNEEQVTR